MTLLPSFCCALGSQAVDSSVSTLAKARQAGAKTEHTLSDFMNAKIEMTIRQEEKEARQQSGRGDDCTYPTPSSSGARLQAPGQVSGGQGHMSGGHGFGSRPSSRASNEMQSSTHEGAVSSTAASSETAESSQAVSGAGDAEGGARPDHLQPPHQAQPSPEASSLMGRGGGVTTSSAETASPMSSSATNRALSPSVGSSQPAPLAKKRIVHRPRFRGDDPPAPPLGSGEKFTTYPASSSRDHTRSSNLPSTSGKAASPAEVTRSTPGTKPTSTAAPAGGGSASSAGASTGSSGKEKKSAQSDLYDFPDSPDEDSSGRTPSSYMALGIPGRSPRKGHVDSSDSSKAPASADTSGVGSTVDERRSSGGEQGGKDGNEAQGYESYPSASAHHHLEPRGHYSSRRDSTDVTTGSVVDSTHREKPASCSGSDDSSTIDSSTTVERKSSKRMSPRRAPDESADGYEASESSQGRSMEGLGYAQHTRSPRARASSTEGGQGFSGADSSSSERSPMGSGSGSGATSSMGMSSYPPFSSSTGSGQPVVSSMMRDPELQAVCSRDQEPAPLLSSQYETLSDDDDN